MPGAAEPLGLRDGSCSCSKRRTWPHIIWKKGIPPGLEQAMRLPAHLRARARQSERSAHAASACEAFFVGRPSICPDGGF